MTNDGWVEIREDLRKRVGKDNYVTWIEPLKLSALTGWRCQLCRPDHVFR